MGVGDWGEWSSSPAWALLRHARLGSWRGGWGRDLGGGFGRRGLSDVLVHVYARPACGGRTGPGFGAGPERMLGALPAGVVGGGLRQPAIHDNQC